MRILMLGATGDMGREATAMLARQPDISHITVTGRTLETVQPLAQSAGPKTHGVVLDVNNRAALVDIMREHDVTAGAIGPYYVYEKPLIEAAIEAKVPYVSLCDDYDGVQDALSLHEKAAAKDVTIMTGIGWTPGITNLLVKKGVALLDEADAAHVSWVASAAGFSGAAVFQHVLHILTGQIPFFIDGAVQHVSAGKNGKYVDFGPEIGKVKVYNMGHPEPITIPHFLPQLKTVTLRGGLLENHLNKTLAAIIRLGLTRTEKRTQTLVRLLTGSRFVPVFERLGLLKEPIAGTHVQVIGQKNHQQADVTYTVTGQAATLTAAPLVIAAGMVGRGEITQAGVLAPETDNIIDPDDFFARLAAMDVVVEGPGLQVQSE